MSSARACDALEGPHARASSAVVKTGQCAAFVAWRRRRERADLVAVCVVALDFQEFGRSTVIEADLDREVGFGFQLGDLLAFAVAEIGGHMGMDGDDDPADLFAVAGERQKPHDVDGHAFGGLGHAGAAAMRAVFVDRAFQAGADALASHLDQAEGTHAKDLGASPVALDGLAEGTLDAAAVAFFAHVDEIVDDHAAQIAEPELSARFPWRPASSFRRPFARRRPRPGSCPS